MRFVDGRLISGITTQFLSWCSEKLYAGGKKVWVLIWNNASWHISKEVRGWINYHNRESKRAGEGVRIISCHLPKKSPWLNAMEPKWIHGKRKVVEADRLLGLRVGRTRLHSLRVSTLRASIPSRKCCLIMH